MSATCPICKEESLGWWGRVVLPFTGELRCGSCQCRLRASKGDAGDVLLGWSVWVVLMLGVAIAVWHSNSAFFLLGVGASIGLQLLAPVELDERDAPSVRRAQRIQNHLENTAGPTGRS